MDLFWVILNIICAFILISYVLYKSHKKTIAKREKEAAEHENSVEDLIYTDEAE